MDVLGDLKEGHRGIDIRVHRRSISGEQVGSWEEGDVATIRYLSSLEFCMYVF